MNELRTYWDLEPKTRAALSESDVQRFVDAELMLKGVLKVEPLELDPEPSEQKWTPFRVGDRVTHCALTTPGTVVAVGGEAPNDCIVLYDNGKKLGAAFENLKPLVGPQAEHPRPLESAKCACGVSLVTTNAWAGSRQCVDCVLFSTKYSTTAPLTRPPAFPDRNPSRPPSRHDARPVDLDGAWSTPAWEEL